RGGLRMGAAQRGEVLGRRRGFSRAGFRGQGHLTRSLSRADRCCVFAGEISAKRGQGIRPRVWHRIPTCRDSTRVTYSALTARAAYYPDESGFSNYLIHLSAMLPMMGSLNIEP